MVISKGADWGASVERPTDLRIAADDRELAMMLSDGSSRPTAVAAGDMFRTVGSPLLADRTELLALPIDLLSVTLDDDPPITAVAHVLVRSPWHRGGWWRGDVGAVMNAEFVGEFDIAPRGHPNDGRVESLRADRHLGWRDRLAVRQRLPGAQHLPHPAISNRPVRSLTWDFASTRTVFVDGVRHRGVGRIVVDVLADAAMLYA